MPICLRPDVVEAMSVLFKLKHDEMCMNDPNIEGTWMPRLEHAVKCSDCRSCTGYDRFYAAI